MASNNTHDGIVILGHPRSGTTLLRRLLNGHPNICCPGETHLLSACARFLHSQKTADGVDMGVLAGLSFAGFDEEEVIDDLRKFALRFLRTHAAEKGGTRWAEKTAVDSFYIDEIERIFGGHAYFVGIIRHGLDVAISCKDFTEATGVYLENFHPYVRQYLQPLEAFSRSWLDVNESMTRFSERNSESCVLIRYEDLVDSPTEILESVMAFIGEDFDPEMITTGLGNFEDLGFSDHKSFGKKTIARVGRQRWKDISLQQTKRIGDIINPLLEQCGYDPLNVSTDISTEDARRRYEKGLLVQASRLST